MGVQKNSPEKWILSGSWFAYKRPTFWLIALARGLFLTADISSYKSLSHGLYVDDFGFVWIISYSVRDRSCGKVTKIWLKLNLLRPPRATLNSNSALVSQEKAFKCLKEAKHRHHYSDKHIVAQIIKGNVNGFIVFLTGLLWWTVKPRSTSNKDGILF